MASSARTDRPSQSTHRIKLPSIPTYVWVLLGVVVVLVGGLAGWRHFAIGSPRYTLRQVATAFRNHDGTRLAYYLDVDAVTQQVADEGLDWLIASHRRSALRALRADVRVTGTARDSAGRLQLLRNAMAEQGAHAIADLLAGGTSDSANVAERLMEAASAVPPLDVLIGDEHLDFARMGHTTHRGESLVVPVELHYRELDATVVVGVVLAHNGERWRIAEIDKLDDLLDAIDNAQLERLGAINRPIEEQMAATVQLGAPQVSRASRGEVRLVIPVHNLSSNPVRRVTIALEGQGSDDEHAETLDAPLVIPPGATVGLSWSFPESRRGPSRITAMLARPDRLVVRPGLVQLDSAGQVQTLRVFSSYVDARRARSHGHRDDAAADDSTTADSVSLNP